MRRAILLFLPAVLVPGLRTAEAQQEQPYFVTYSSQLEEPGNLEIESQNVAASPANANAFFAPTLELEYGATAWWTAEVYLQGQATANDSAIFTGFRLESRFRVLPSDHWINPVLYLEYEDVNEADKSFLEIVGNDTISTLEVPNDILRQEIERSMEGKLILIALELSLRFLKLQRELGSCVALAGLQISFRLGFELLNVCAVL